MNCQLHFFYIITFSLSLFYGHRPLRPTTVKPRLHQRNMLRGNKLLVERNMLLEATCCAQQAICCRQEATCCGHRATCCAHQATCCGQQATCCPQQVARPRNMLPRNMLRWCKRGITNFLHWSCIFFTHHMLRPVHSMMFVYLNSYITLYENKFSVTK